MTRIGLLLLIACSSQSRPDAATANGPFAPTPEEPVRTAPHGTAIEQLAVSDDGTAAVTQDGMGGSRLWPTLDGTREPVIVTLAPAVELALRRDAEGYVVAARDQVGGLEIVRFAASGHELSHTRLPPEPAVDRIAIVSQGVLAVREDQTLAIYAANGQLRARLEADAGMRMKWLAARNDRAIVLYEQDGALRGRWVAYLDWGFDTPALDFKPLTAVHLSSSGTSLLIDNMDGAARMIEINTGDAVVDFGALMPVGFADDTTQVLRSGTQIKWAHGRRDTMKDGVLALDRVAEYAVANGMMVETHRQSLALHTPAGVKYLGYGASHVGLARVVGERILVGDGDQTPLWLDKTLVAREGLRLPEDPRVLEDAVAIDERFVVVAHSIGGHGHLSVSVIDREKNETRQTIQHAVIGDRVQYEPSTGLLAIGDAAANYVARWDADTQMFGVWYRLATDKGSIHLFDPSRTDGIVAITLQSIGDAIHIAEFHRDDLAVGKAIQPRMTYRVQGRLADIDRDGRIYVQSGTDLMIYEGREAVRSFDVGEATTFAAHPRGTHIAALGTSLLRLYDAAGTLKWETTAPLANTLHWLGDDLVVDYLAGLGKIDAATGALIHRTCGWSFGVYALPNNEARELESICDAP